MIPGHEAQRIKAKLVIWWIIWAAILNGLVVIYLSLARNQPLPPPVSAELFTNLVGFLPLFLSIIVRWLVLPRYVNPARALVMFIVGLALAESCGLLGIFLGGGYRDALFALGVLGVIQYVPVFAKRFYEPRPTGFIPNN